LKEPEHIAPQVADVVRCFDEVVEHARRFLKAHEPVTAGR
jgi:hypothetical protein